MTSIKTFNLNTHIYFNKLKRHFSNIERTQMCSFLGDQTRTPYFLLWTKEHWLSNLIKLSLDSLKYSSNSLEHHFFEHWMNLNSSIGHFWLELNSWLFFPFQPCEQISSNLSHVHDCKCTKVKTLPPSLPQESKALKFNLKNISFEEVTFFGIEFLCLFATFSVQLFSFAKNDPT